MNYDIEGAARARWRNLPVPEMKTWPEWARRAVVALCQKWSDDLDRSLNRKFR
jgi:hypothetical protein